MEATQQEGARRKNHTTIKEGTMDTQPQSTTPRLSIEELIDTIIGDRPNTLNIEYNPEWTVYDSGPRWLVRYYPQTPIGQWVFEGEDLRPVLEECLAARLAEVPNAADSDSASESTSQPNETRP